VTAFRITDARRRCLQLAEHGELIEIDRSDIGGSARYRELMTGDRIDPRPVRALRKAGLLTRTPSGALTITPAGRDALR
jgi:hypothetical protein